MNYEESIGLKNSILSKKERKRLQLYINLKLASTGQPFALAGDEEFMSSAQDLLQSYREKNRLLTGHQCPIDQRVQAFLDSYLADCEGETPRLPGNSLVLDRYGLARELSLPSKGEKFKSDIVSSYRIRQGVLNNPANDRRTTKGSFHVTEGGLPIAGDKLSVPKIAFQNLLKAALNPPESLLQLPFTSNQEHRAALFVSLYLRPTVVPGVPAFSDEKSMEIRFFAPGNLVSNLDFVESIFGNAGNPYLPEHDAALDVDHWSGHTGCVILAPHLISLTKKELGLPNIKDASEQQKAQGMCWQSEGEKYNDGNAFKITARDANGVIVTLIADNYYGYCKKEVKTQIGFAANLHGLAEEEHAGGALAFQRRNHGDEYGVDSRTRNFPHSFADMCQRMGAYIDIQPEGYAIDKKFPDLIYLPQDIRMEIMGQRIRWNNEHGPQTLKLQPGKVYMQPSGYKIEMVKHPGAPSWRLVGTDPEGTFCHKPSTVSGGGKSEISKSLDDAVIYGPIFIHDFDEDMDAVQDIFDKDYSGRLKPKHAHEDRDPSRKPLSAERSLGSVIKLLTPSPSNKDSYNEWLESIPDRILSLVFVIKRMHHSDEQGDWRSRFSVDIVNGHPSHILKVGDRELVMSYLRVGLDEQGDWHTFKLRQDFIACEKVQMEDDITASVVVPAAVLPNNSPKFSGPSVKLTKNCEYRLFQRPDEAIHRGYDKQTEFDMAQANTFVANFEPLKGKKLKQEVEDVVSFQAYTAPMQALLQAAYEDGDEYVVSSARPREINGEPSQNPRYLQLRPDLQQPFRTYVARTGTRLWRRLEADAPVVQPVNAVLTGRRNNPPGEGIRPLAVFNPIHYQELPELFMDFICSVTGKSPSTTGAGSEGALTKAPFNALLTTSDLNNALVSYIICGYDGFSSAAGYIGPRLRVDHDISLLIPEIWARLEEHERSADYLIAQGQLEKIDDFEFEGQTILASRLGYRITDRFVAAYLGKIFDSPAVVFDETILKPETQDLAVFADGVNNIVEAQQRVALQYFEDGSAEHACPPIKAILHIMAYGSYEGKTANDPEIRALFTRENMLESAWYRERLQTQQQREIQLQERNLQALQRFLEDGIHVDVAEKMDITGRIEKTAKRLAFAKTKDFLKGIEGTIGADPIS